MPEPLSEFDILHIWPKNLETLKAEYAFMVEKYGLANIARAAGRELRPPTEQDIHG
jgi:hypothetical protein